MRSHVRALTAQLTAAGVDPMRLAAIARRMMALAEAVDAEATALLAAAVTTDALAVATLDPAAFAAPVGQVTEPVKSQFGYHLILVEKHETKTFDEVRPEIEKKIRPELAKKAVDDLKKQTPVVIDPEFFGPEAPAPAK